MTVGNVTIVILGTPTHNHALSVLSQLKNDAKAPKRTRETRPEDHAEPEDIFFHTRTGNMYTSHTAPRPPDNLTASAAYLHASMCV